MAKAKLLKGFVHNGKAYNPGDDFEGSDSEIADLVRQGYMKQEGKETEPAEKPAHK
jgi:hypothetical protein